MKKVLIALVVLVVVAIAGVFGYFYVQDRRVESFVTAPFGTPDTKTVEIPPGTPAPLIAKMLADAKVIASDDLAVAYLKRDKLGAKLKAGEYEFTGPLTPVQVFELVMSGKVKMHHFTVPEGLRVDETLPILAASDMHLSLEKLQKLSTDPKFLKKAGVPAANLEGFLFPDTYSFPKGKNEEDVLKKMVARTIDEYQQAPKRAGIDYDLLQGITMASIIEKETGANELDEGRAHISCVFANRLHDHTKLQTDPTVLYAKFLRNGTFNKSIFQSDLDFDHPYNTYRNQGLPPGPIASPGRGAIRAAMNPLSCKDVFFVANCDGTSTFCPDLKCHNAAVERYRKCKNR
ncbi:MAG: endolytic transglycosylase MltG [Myxococcaceae bacterium]